MRYTLPVAVFAATFPIAVQAQGVEDFFLGRLILAAGLSPAPQAALGRAVTVIDATELERRGIDTVADALRAVPGVGIGRDGGPGGLTQARLRGTESRHVQVLIDGVRIDPPQDGFFDFAGLQTGDISSIEIIRGPQSAFFGSNTIGGVISITTRQGTEPGTSGSAVVEAGSDGTLGTNFALSQRGEQGGFTLSGIVRNEGGYDISATPGGARDGMRNRTLTFSGDYRINDDWTVGLLLRARNQTNDADPQQYAAGPIEDIVFDRNDFRKLQERIGSITAQGSLLDGRVELNLRASRFRLDSQSFQDAAQSNDITSNRSELALRGVIGIDGATPMASRHTLGFGLDWTREDFVNNDPALVFDPSMLEKQARTLAGASLEYRGNLAEGLDLQLGARYDRNDRFRDFLTYSAALSYALPETGTRLKASFGTGVQNPTLFNQFGFIPGTWEGNPDLEPEQSRGWDIGIEQTFLGGQLLASATYFDNTLSNRIITGPGSAPGISTPINADGKSRRTGVELGLTGQITDTIGLRSSYTYTRARGENNEALARRPKHELGLGVDWDATDRLRVSADLRHVAGNLDLDFRGFAFADTPVVKLPDYTLVNLSASYAINDRVSLTGRINNVFDRSYQEVLGYSGQGRTAYVGLSTRF